MADAAAPQPEIKRLHRHKLPTGALSVDATADGGTLYAACMDGVYRLNGTSGERERLYAHESYASGVALFEAANLLVSSGYDGALTWYDLAGMKKIRTEKAHDFWSWQLARSADGKYVASVTGQYLCGSYKYEPAPEKEPSVRVYEVASGKLAYSFPHVPSVQSVAFSPDSKFVAAGNLMGEVRIWDLQTGKQGAQWKTDAFTSWGIIKSHCYLGGIFGMTFTPDGSALLVCGMGPMRDPMAGNGTQLWQRYAWKEATPKLIDQTKSSEAGEGLMEALAVHPNGQFVMSGRLRGGAWNTGIFSLADGGLKQSFKTDSRITRALFTADGKRMILGGMQRQPGFNKEGVIPDFGHVDIFECPA